MKKKFKICSKCKQEKSINKFSKDKKRKDNLDVLCKICRNKVNRKSVLKLHLDKTPKQCQELLEAQKGCCAICGIHQSKLKKNLAIDHSHKTGIIRGLLCDKCNLTLGHYEKHQEECKKYLREVPKRIIPLYKKWLKEENK